ncbi:hypothetical protein Peur_006847 [Populus x canadensis]
MLSSKLLPEMEVDYNSKSEQWLQGMQNLPIFSQIEKLKFGTRQGPTTLPTLDKAQAAKIQEQETLLRAAANVGRTYHPSFVLYASRPTCIWRPEADYISTSSALGRCAGCLMECIAFLILLIPNMSSTISSQPLVPRMQNGRLSSAFLIRSMQCVYNTGVSNPGGVMPIQQQQLGSQEAFGNMQPNAQNLQSSMAVTVYFS